MIAFPWSAPTSEPGVTDGRSRHGRRTSADHAAGDACLAPTVDPMWSAAMPEDPEASETDATGSERGRAAPRSIPRPSPTISGQRVPSLGRWRVRGKGLRLVTRIGRVNGPWRLKSRLSTTGVASRCWRRAPGLASHSRISSPLSDGPRCRASARLSRPTRSTSKSSSSARTCRYWRPRSVINQSDLRCSRDGAIICVCIGSSTRSPGRLRCSTPISNATSRRWPRGRSRRLTDPWRTRRLRRIPRSGTR